MSETDKSLINDIKQIIDLTSRVDERVKIIGEVQQEINSRLNEIIDEHNTLKSRVFVLESKNSNKLYDSIANQEEKIIRVSSRLEILETIGSKKQQRTIDEISSIVVALRSRVKELEEQKRSRNDRIQSALNYVWKGIFIIVLCFILYKLGLNPMPLP